MRKIFLTTCLAVASASSPAAGLAADNERELRVATLAVLSYGGFVALVQRDCLPAQPAPQLVKEWQKRHKPVLDSADAFAESMFAKAAKEGRRAESEAELAYVVGQAAHQLYREQANDVSQKVACPSLVSKVKAGEFDAGDGRRMQPHVQVLTQWAGVQKKSKR